MGNLAGLRIRLSNALAQITVRLRIALFVIASVTSIAGVAAILQARTILTAYTELNLSAQPMLTLSTQMEGNLRELSLLLQTLPTVDSKPALDRLDQEISTQVRKTRQDLLEMTDYGISTRLIDDFNQRLSATRISAGAALSARVKYLTTRTELSMSVAKILTLQNSSQRILEEFIFDVTSQTDNLVRTDIGNGLAARSDTDAQLAGLFQSSLNISSMGYALDTVVTAAIHADDNEGNAPSNKTVLHTTEELRDIVSGLPLLPNTPERRELAAQVLQLRELVIGANGVFSRQTDQSELRQSFTKKHTDHLPLLAEISVMATELVNRSLTIVDRSSEELRGALQNLIWVLTGAMIVSMVAIVFTNRAIIERQFNRRIKILNESVRAISGGELNHSVPVSGPDELGEMAGALSIFKHNAKELRRSNIELEKFAYVAAHDLRSPLRAISDLSSWIIEDEENVLSIESSAYLTLLQERTGRLDRLLCDLLAYARAGENDPEVELIDLSACVRDQILYANTNDRFNIAYVGPDVLIKTHLTPLQQILSNLLSNAIRHHDCNQGKIEISTEVWPNRLTLIVSDDGPGIEEQYQERIFELFQTLQPRDEVEGSGLGLAIIKKIVERNKGIVTIFSDPAVRRGTTFTVSIPLTETPIFVDQGPSLTAA